MNKFSKNYTISSNLVLCSFIIGIAIVFIRGLEDWGDILISGVFLALRYFSVFLIKRRFTWAKYLLIILIAKTIHRLFNLETSPEFNTFAISLVILQIIITVTALFLIVKIPKLELKRKLDVNNKSSQ
ncbi:hypothetical protein [Pedobacter boryungensis]|uniref:Uncharacterized protein n=1 Tax=Pedobacter boryungensis TaxID=869962 RepID=A0ABX2DI71_9SPHI|nr:hypothetical protein [Pedobacter boryungensis]NQX32636.1 hypothetical protein [Pedobacter boryungensis]